MSKSTNRYGKVTLNMRSFIEAYPKPSENLIRHWNWLDKVSNFLYGCKYFDLKDKTRVILHEIIKGVDDEGYSDKRLKLKQAKLL